LSRITLVPGAHRLPTNLRSFPIDFVQEVEFGPRRLPGTPEGEGSCAYAPEGGAHGYDCNQTFLVDGTPLRINYHLQFSDGAEPVLFDQEYSAYPMMEGFLGPGEDYLTEQIQFADCTQDYYSTWEITFEWENGDQTVFHQPGWNRPLHFPGYVGETSPSNLVWAQVTLGGETREVSDYFHLVYAARHHNWGEEYLVILDPPVGDVHGLYCMDSGDIGTDPPEFLYYLGADLDPANPLDTTGYTSHQVEQLP
jgi:hypothetical protein